MRAKKETFMLQLSLEWKFLIQPLLKESSVWSCTSLSEHSNNAQPSPTSQTPATSALVSIQNDITTALIGSSALFDKFQGKS